MRTEHGMVEIQEQERLRIARELHDEAGQALTALMIQLTLLQRDAANADRVRAGIDVLMGEVESLMKNLHGLTMGLRPANLDLLGLVAALEQYCRALAERHEIRVTLKVTGFEGRIAPAVETALYRIVQEALNNVVRHARATRADVVLERRGQRIVVVVKDNGQGFDPEAASARQPDHLGLRGMEERAIALGGSLTIKSRPCRGTALLVEVPDAYPGSDCR